MKIEKKIPIPKHNTYRGIYPWGQLEPGDSFTVDVPQGKTAAQTQAILLNCGREWAARRSWYDMKFTSRIIDDGTRVRIWRIA